MPRKVVFWTDENVGWVDSHISDLAQVFGDCVCRHQGFNQLPVYRTPEIELLIVATHNSSMITVRLNEMKRRDRDLPKILLLVTTSQPLGFEETLDLMSRFGVMGFLHFTRPFHLFRVAVTSVILGQVFFEKLATAMSAWDLVTEAASAEAQMRRGKRVSLTTREQEILKLLAEGQTVKEIAADLNLSVKTVEAHKFNLMRKLDIHNKADLVQFALAKGIITLKHFPQQALKLLSGKVTS